jgi:hypothetical protein
MGQGFRICMCPNHLGDCYIIFLFNGFPIPKINKGARPCRAPIQLKLPKERYWLYLGRQGVIASNPKRNPTD